jgi:hypothetical protein
VQSALWAGLAALVGLVVGRLWDIRSESRRWRRDRRVESYQEVASVFYQYREAIRALGRTARPSAAFDEQRNEVDRFRTEWNRALAGLWLRGSEEAARCALAVDYSLVTLAHRATTGPIELHEWPLVREPAQTAYDDFIDAIRGDLGLPPLAVLRVGASTRSAPPSAPDTASS